MSHDTRLGSSGYGTVVVDDDAVAAFAQNPFSTAFLQVTPHSGCDQALSFPLCDQPRAMHPSAQEIHLDRQGAYC